MTLDPDRDATPAGTATPDVYRGEVLPAESIEAIKDRLRARGLLAEPAAQPGGEDGAALDASAPPEAAPPRLVSFADDVLEPATPTAAVPEDAWDVQGTGALVHVRCPGCRTVAQAPADVTRFRCDACDRPWRFAICGSCDELTLTLEAQESWRCSCGSFTRSWWRTSAAARDALAVVGRRRHLAVLEERRIVREGMRARRWKLVAFAIVAMLATLCVVAYVRLNEPTTAVDARTVCVAVDDLRAELASGNLSHAGFKAALDGIEAKSAGLGGPVGDAILDLVAAGPPGTTEFLVAQTNVADACERVRNP